MPVASMWAAALDKSVPIYTRGQIRLAVTSVTIGGMDRRELDAICNRLIECVNDADAIAAAVPPSQVYPTLRRLGRASITLGRTMRAIERENGRDAGSHLRSRFVTCSVCLDDFGATRSDARYCSARCRVAAHRRRVTAVTTPR